MKLHNIDREDAAWDIPVLPMKAETRRLLFTQALRLANRSGFVVPVGKGLVLAWKDDSETRWLGDLAYRAWSCSEQPLTTSDLSKLSEAFNRHNVSFAAVSGWQPFSDCEDFIDVGCSVHALLNGLRHEITDSSKANLSIRRLGDIPDEWIETIVGHIISSTWFDRHAKDPIFDPLLVRKRRVDWIRRLLKEGDGFLTVVFKSSEEIGAYAVVPIDRSRQPFGGPVVAGINGISGSISEGFGFFRRAITESFRQEKSPWQPVIIQYQPDNLASARIITRTFNITSCCRYDIHWRKKSKSVTRGLI